jgi:hypothetical protein
MPKTINIKEQDYQKLETEANKQNKTVTQYVEGLVEIARNLDIIETEDRTQETEYKEVTVKIPKAHYDALMKYYNSHPYYADFSDFLLESIREYNLTRIIQQSI